MKCLLPGSDNGISRRLKYRIGDTAPSFRNPSVIQLLIPFYPFDRLGIMYVLFSHILCQYLTKSSGRLSLISMHPPCFSPRADIALHTELFEGGGLEQ